MSRAEGKSDIDLFAVRSLLFLPASNQRAIAKARAAGSDLVVLDLEDAVKPADKVRAFSIARGLDAGRNSSERTANRSMSLFPSALLITVASCAEIG